MLAHRQSCTRSPIKRLFNRLEQTHTYINYHKTHPMATCFGGTGITSEDDPKTQNVDNSGDKSQDEDIIKQLCHKTALLKQYIEDNEPRDAIHNLEQRLDRLTLMLHQSDTPIENVLDKYTETLCTTQKKTSLESSLLHDIPILNGQDSSQLEDWLTNIETASE